MKKYAVCFVILAIIILLILFFSTFAIFGISSPLENSIRFPMTDLSIKAVNGIPNDTSKHDESLSLFLTYSDKVIFDHQAEVTYRLAKSGPLSAYRLVGISYLFKLSDSVEAEAFDESITEKMQSLYRENENYFVDESTDTKEHEFGLNFGATAFSVTVEREENELSVFISYLT